MAERVSAGERAAERILREKDGLAREATDALYGERPELLDRYGEAGREKCRQDLRFNLEHLAPALALEQPQMFEGYVRWLVEMLGARGIPAGDIERSLVLTGDAIARRFPADEAAAARATLAAGLRALETHGR
jgi:hypothetical protein